MDFFSLTDWTNLGKNIKKGEKGKNWNLTTGFLRTMLGISNLTKCAIHKYAEYTYN